MEVLDSFFGNVCELDLVFNFYKVRGRGPQGGGGGGLGGDGGGIEGLIWFGGIGLRDSGRGVFGWGD